MHRTSILKIASIDIREIRKRKTTVRWGNNKEGNNKVKGVTKLDLVTKSLHY